MSELIINPSELGGNKSSAQLIINTFGLGNVRTVAYGAGMPSPNQKDTPKGGMSKMLGNPVFSNLSIDGGQYTDNNGVLITYNPINIDTVLFNVSQNKNIIVTPVQGQAGSVKEYISDQDYTINLVGVLTAPNGQYPFQDMGDLVKILQAPVPLVVNSWYLQLFGVYNIVITGYDLGMRPGFYSQQAFSINAISDKPVELKIAK